jgi:hypothetical protein
VVVERRWMHFDRLDYPPITRAVMPFFYLPSIKRLSVPIDSHLEFRWLGWPGELVGGPRELPPSPSSLTSLKLFHIREMHLDHILSRTPNLKSLAWEWYHDMFTEDGFMHHQVVDLNLIIPAISHVRDSLTELTISAYCQCQRKRRGFRRPSLRLEGSSRGFAGLDKLKRLTLPLAFIFGFTANSTERLEHCLPPNLEFLNLSDELLRGQYYQDSNYLDCILDHHLGAVSSWLKTVETSTPRLRQLCIRLWFGFSDQHLESTIRKVCAQAGIEVEILWPRNSPYIPRGW